MSAFAFLALGSPAPGLAQDRGDRWTDAGIAFVRLLNELKFDSAAARVSAKIPAGSLSPDRLGQIWARVTEVAGALVEVLPGNLTVQNGQHVVDLDVRFERQPLRIRIVVDDSLELTGLWFLPPEPPQWSPPAWVDTTAFHEVEVTVGTDPWILPGTLSLPTSPGPYPAILLVHGSGPQDRDETIGPNRPFRDIAAGLAARGIAVLRYEKRTKQYASRIDPKAFTLEQEVIEDALAAVALLRARGDIDTANVRVAGHSLGAMLAPEIAIPILVLQGGRVYQVTDSDLSIWRQRLRRDNVTIRDFPTLNHLFMEGTGRATPSEYGNAGHVAIDVIEALATRVRDTR